MAQLSLSFCGTFQVMRAGQLVTGFRTDKVRALLAYLAVEANQPHRREALAGLLWPEIPDRTARANLRLTLVRLRQALGPTPFLHSTSQTVQFNLSAECGLDVAEFSRLFQECQTHRHRRLATCPVCRPRLEEAGALYRGDFLCDFSTDSAVFENWLMVQREALRQQARTVFETLAENALLRGDFAAAQRQARRQLALEPWDEHAHRVLMQALALTGQRSAALAQYEACRRLLAGELGVDPSPETQTLYELLQANAVEARVGRPPVNLPTSLTPFIGRQEEVKQLLDHLQNPDCRLVTLVGPGGIGKTRLALEAAAAPAQAGAFAHGVFFVPLLAVNSEDMLLTAIAHALDFSFDGAETLRTQLVRYLRQREVLLVLDNFEHLLQAELGPACKEMLLTLLRAAPQVVLLVTSRERLKLQLEIVFPLKGLTYPETAPGRAETYDAVQLFVERARRAQAFFELSAANARDVVRICQLVKGLPLGLELAASWTGTLACAAIAAAIGRNQQLLTTTQRDLPERHRSLQAVFEHSWQLLSETERAVFGRLAVFRGAFSQEAAAEVSGATLTDLAALADKSLVRLGAADMYEIHALLSQWVQGKLTEAERAQVRDRHSAYYAAFLQRRRAALRGGAQTQALADIEHELDDVRAAWEWAAQTGRLADLEQSADALFHFYDMRSRFQEGEAVFESARQFLETQATEATLTLRAKLLARQGWFNFHSGQPELARQRLQASLMTLHRLNAQTDESFCLNYLGAIARYDGDYAQARGWLQACLELTPATGDRYGASIALNILGQVAYMEGQYAEAQRFCREGLALKVEIGDRWGSMYSLSYLGLVARALHEYAEARQCLTESLGISQQIGDRRGTASSLNYLGETAEALGEYGEARQLYRRALAIFREIGNPLWIMQSLLLISRVDRALGERPSVRACLQEALELARSLQAADRVQSLEGMLRELE